MKKLMTALALATLVASPALADSAKSSKARSMSGQQSYAAGNAGYDAFAAADNGVTIGGPAIFVNGVYVGWDPDPAIRLQLIKDPLPQYQGN